MKVKIAVFFVFILIVVALPASANQAAIIPAYAFVSATQSSMKEYHHLIGAKKRAAARQLIASEKVFLSPRDVKVEVVTFDQSIAKVKLSRLDENAEPITLYFWTLADQLKFIQQE